MFVLSATTVLICFFKPHRVFNYPFILFCFSENCPAGWFYYERYCYYHFIPRSSNLYRDTAAAYCLSNGAHLISFRDAAEESNVNEYVHQQGVTRNIWIGLKFQNGNFTTDQGQPVIFTRWASGQPVLGNPDGDCAYISHNHNTRRSLWKVANCGATGLHIDYLCKKPSGTSTKS